jgi:hypothetical protein
LWWGDLRGSDHLEDLSVDRKILLKVDLKEVEWGGMGRIDLVQDTDRWWAFPNL